MQDTSSLPAWLQAIAAIVTAVVSFFVLRQLSLAKRQLELTVNQIDLARVQMKLGTQWNKLNATFTYFTNEMFIERERAVADKLSSIGVDLYIANKPLNDDIVQKMIEDKSIYRDTKDYLNLIEDYAAAVRVGALDYDCSYAIMSGIIVRYHQVFLPFIKRLRNDFDDHECYIEIEKLALDWQAKYEHEKNENMRRMEEIRQKTEGEIEEKKRLLEEELKQVEHQLNQNKGIKPKV